MSWPIAIALLISAALFVAYLYFFLAPIIRDPTIVAPHSTRQAKLSAGRKKENLVDKWLSPVEGLSDDSHNSKHLSSTQCSTSVRRHRNPNGVVVEEITPTWSSSHVGVRVDRRDTAPLAYISPPPPAYVSHPNTPSPNYFLPEYDTGYRASPPPSPGGSNNSGLSSSSASHQTYPSSFSPSFPSSPLPHYARSPRTGAETLAVPSFSNSGRGRSYSHSTSTSHSGYSASSYHHTNGPDHHNHPPQIRSKNTQPAQPETHPAQRQPQQQHSPRVLPPLHPNPITSSISFGGADARYLNPPLPPGLATSRQMPKSDDHGHYGRPYFYPPSSMPRHSISDSMLHMLDSVRRPIVALHMFPPKSTIGQMSKRSHPDSRPVGNTAGSL